MRAERGGSSNLIRSFVSLSSTQLANKENSSLPALSPVAARHYIRRRRSRTRTVVAGTVLRRDRSRIARPNPSHDNEPMVMPNPNSEPEPPAQRRVTLPRHLLRPRYRPIDPRVITTIDPSLDDIPLNYIQHTLEEIGPRLLQVTSKATATPPLGHLPRQMQIICHDISIEPPSHVLAVYARTDAPRCGITLFPAHALVLATNCAHLPNLPPSKPRTPTEPGAAVVLPVVPLRIPSPATFPALLSYLYTKRSDHMLSELLPLPMDDDAASMDQLARKHATTFSIPALVDYTRTVYGLWSNASALGIFDDKLFRTMEMAWEVLLQALAIGSGANLAEGIQANAE